ncbi:MAG TPA: protein kinase family protein [Nocardioidaceae bacterium]|nr:protein kinase family protein [Nocardioidaceae bacterium]
MTPISPGTLLAGRFRLEDLLEETGGARFWRATDLTLMRDVAVHVLEANDPRSEALMAAARSSATVSGPHLLRVLDAAVEDGVAYVVNEWGNGVSLDRMLLEGPLPPRQAAWLVREVAEAIAEAHRVGVAHGRLVPENVMVNENGAVKLIGFCIDCVLHGRPSSGLTEEQADVRDLAALLYAALVGRWPGTGESTLAAAPRDHGKVLRARQVRAGIPTSLDRLCDTVLNDDAGFPIDSAHEIKAALADFLGEAGEGRPVGRHASPGPGDATERIEMPAVVETGELPPAPGGVGDPQPQDPDATQTAMPLFADEATQVVRPSPASPSPASPGPLPPGPLPPGDVHPSTKTPYVGMGGGVLPPAWGPDARREAAPDVRDEWEEEPPGSSWLRLAGLVAAALVLVVAVVFAFNLGRGSSPETTGDTDPTGTPAPSAQVLTPASVDDFDPFGDDGAENPEDVGAAHDDDRTTAWTTSTYVDGPPLAPYKEGVGLLVDLGSEQPVADVQLQLQGAPSGVALLAAPAGSGVPSGMEGLEEVARDDQAAEQVTLTPGQEVTTRYLVIWFTSLPQVSDGYRGAVAEIVVRS